ncbi:envelope glycoprotein D [Canid alphaherpesvirus 1]|uniref:CUS6 n=5 Tax=Canid alphaherpesvirus 1 TaxID=170325 RepID=O41524_9ALPH|nr:envelope glycoprotein D [Canid alphaherpesvirus 1]AAB67058.1 cUS6 [Canid alphaherpesvirus 1]AAK51062.1 glycoprotein D [Canid alphaherpesvirus 1]ALL25944.1 envelope glycoprotein D [Canid alphaherpesvirus 1]ALL26024.1 envelope glycoprotein D [Canid alphaherpesvirus 1]ALL26100.1 envelope glycoprotein D [Canid alphaherpesvirus 1]
MIKLLFILFYFNPITGYKWVDPPRRYNYTVLRMIPDIPNPMDPSKNAEVRYVTSTDPCDMVALISNPNIESTIKTIQFVQKKKFYNASLSWFKVGDDCTYPIYLIQYFDCDPQREFGICLKRSPDFWKPSLVGYTFLTDDELGLVLAAPAPFNQGQYRRVIQIENEVFYTDFMVQLPRETCYFSKEDKFEPTFMEWCKESRSVGASKVDDELFYLNRAGPQTLLKYYVIKDFYRLNGREPPIKFKEALRYDIPYKVNDKFDDELPSRPHISNTINKTIKEIVNLEDYFKNTNVIDTTTPTPINNTPKNITVGIVIIILIILFIIGFFVYKRQKIYNNYKKLTTNV